MANEVKLPALKENVDTVEVDTVNVKPGDVVAKDQSLMVVQADKATLDVPSPMAGRVAKVLVKSGDEVKIGQAFVVIEETNGAPDGNAPTAPRPAEPKDDGRAATKQLSPAEKTEAAEAVNEAPAKAAPARTQPSPSSTTDKPVLAGPATRRLARELGVDLHQVKGTGRSSRVMQEDVKAYVRQLSSAGAPLAAEPAVQAPPLPRFEDWGPVERQKLDAIRRQTARQTSVAWTLIPHVTQHDLADVTDLEAFRKQQDGKGPKLTMTAFALKAASIVLQQFPSFNASLDLAAGQLILKRYYHIGIAVDTDHGLLVPVIRDVDKKSVTDLAKELSEVAERGRQRKVQLEEMRGGTFTISNLGGIGGTGFTPIINYPEVAILGLSRARLQPAVRDGQMVPRLLLPLSLSYDHRVIDGAAAARFTRRIAEMLENPLQMVLYA
jgi:pyruvate dehydrogenase E2 component (dihydrolipoamide acetyltransferase)